MPARDVDAGMAGADLQLRVRPLHLAGMLANASVVARCVVEASLV
jgi:hypothetical protein